MESFIMKFPEPNESSFGELLYTKLISECVKDYGLPENPKDYLIPTRQLPTCIEFVLPKKVKAYKRSEVSKGTQINKRKITACVMNWGMSKLRSVPEYKDLIEGRVNKSFEVESADEARLYRSRNSRGIFKRVKEMDDFDHPYVLQSDEYLSNQIGEIAPVLMMSNYEFAIFLLCLGLRYGDMDESHIDEKYRLKQWEIDNLDDVILISQNHMRSLADEIRHFEYKQSIKNENLFN